jgi:hypothetical protein
MGPRTILFCPSDFERASSDDRLVTGREGRKRGSEQGIPPFPKVGNTPERSRSAPLRKSGMSIVPIPLYRFLAERMVAEISSRPGSPAAIQSCPAFLRFSLRFPSYFLGMPQPQCLPAEGGTTRSRSKDSKERGSNAAVLSESRSTPCSNRDSPSRESGIRPRERIDDHAG